MPRGQEGRQSKALETKKARCQVGSGPAQRAECCQFILPCTPHPQPRHHAQLRVECADVVCAARIIGVYCSSYESVRSGRFKQTVQVCVAKNTATAASGQAIDKSLAFRDDHL